MDFQQSIKVCFSKYADFSGVAGRPEFWWFVLFTVLVCAALSIISESLGMIFNLGVLLPTLAAGTRRLRDSGRSGWWQLLWLLPLVGWIVLVYLLAQPGMTRADASAATL